MLAISLKAFFESYDLIRESLKNFSEEKTPIHEKTIKQLSDLVLLNICTLSAFKVLLKVAPETALEIIKERFLSVDLSDHVKDQVEYLDIMFSDIREILGDDKFQEVLNCPEFLPKNKRNRRVKEAIAFALDED